MHETLHRILLLTWAAFRPASKFEIAFFLAFTTGYMAYKAVYLAWHFCRSRRLETA